MEPTTDQFLSSGCSRRRQERLENVNLQAYPAVSQKGCSRHADRVQVDRSQTKLLPLRRYSFLSRYEKRLQGPWASSRLRHSTYHSVFKQVITALQHLPASSSHYLTTSFLDPWFLKAKWTLSAALRLAKMTSNFPSAQRGQNEMQPHLIYLSITQRLKNLFKSSTVQTPNK